MLQPILCLKNTSINAFNPQAKVLEDMYNCLDMELSYVAMVLLIMLSRAMGNSLKAINYFSRGPPLPGGQENSYQLRPCHTSSASSWASPGVDIES